MPPLRSVVPGASVVRLVSGVLFPTAPSNSVTPAVFTTRLKAPSTVFPNVTLPEPVEVSVALPVSTTASLYVWAPVVLTIPPLRSVVPGASVVRLVSGVLFPTAPSNSVTPAVFTTRLKAPSTVFPNVTLPEPVEVSVALPVSTTASLYVWAPVVLTIPPLRSVVPGASVVRLVSGVLFPTAPSNSVTPAVFTTRLKAPSTVFPNVTLPEPVEVSVALPVSTTASLYVWAPVVLTIPPLRSVVPGASVVRLVSGVLFPTAPSNSVTPAVFTTRLKAPSTVFPNVTLPEPVEVSVALPVSTTASLYVWAPVVLTIPPLRSVVPGASVFRLVSGVPFPTAPSNSVTPAVFTTRLKAPSTVFPNVTLPEAVEVSVALPVSTTASLYVWAPVVLTIPPLRSVVPGASVVRLVSGVLFPTAPSNSVTPAVFTTRLKAPSTVFPNVTCPEAVEVSVALPVSTTASLYVWAPVVLTIPPLRSVVPGASVVRLVSGVLFPTAPSNSV